MHYVYFVQARGSGYSIKICSTYDCPYVRLNNLRSAMRKSISHIELLGTIAISDEHYQSSPYTQNRIHAQFECLRDTHKKGDWFLPGVELLAFIRVHARPHFCSRLCSGGTSIYEEMLAADDATSTMIDALIAKDA